MLRPTPRPAVARLLDSGDRLLRIVGVPRPILTPESAKAEARDATKLDDFGTNDFEEGLEVFCRSAEQDARLDMVGRGVVKGVLRRVLSNRLLLVDHRKRCPETFDTRLTAPIIVLGLGRTGTTYLHRLLSQDSEAYGPPAWQVWRPLPRTSGPDRRRDITIRALVGLRQLAPDLDVKHYQDADEPEECYHLLDPSLRAPGLSMLCPAWGYFDWVRKQDLSPAYQMYRQYLQVIQKEVPGRRLTLKAPLHTPYMDRIIAEIPNALFVQTHRDPVQAAGSLASLMLSMFGLTSPQVKAKELGAVALELMRWTAERTIEQRNNADLPVADVQYTDLIQDPVATVRQIYEVHRLTWTKEVATAIANAAATRPQHKHGKHRYELRDFGLSETQVRSALEPYTTRYLRG